MAISPFRGKVVAYKTNSLYYRSGYSVDGTHFGFIDPSFTMWSSSCKGYRITRATKPTAFAKHCVFTDDQLKGTDISMRLATAEEVALLREAITNDQAKFEYMVGKDRMNKILVEHLLDT